MEGSSPIHVLGNHCIKINDSAEEMTQEKLLGLKPQYLHANHPIEGETNKIDVDEAKENGQEYKKILKSKLWESSLEVDRSETKNDPKDSLNDFKEDVPSSSFTVKSTDDSVEEITQEELFFPIAAKSLEGLEPQYSHANPMIEGEDESSKIDVDEAKENGQGYKKILKSELWESSLEVDRSETKNDPKDSLNDLKKDKRSSKYSYDWKPPTNLRELTDFFTKTVLHVKQCFNPSCNEPKCRRMKRIFAHANKCTIERKKNCPICYMLLDLNFRHARRCNVEQCQLVMCSTIKTIIKARILELSVARNLQLLKLS